MIQFKDSTEVQSLLQQQLESLKSESKALSKSLFEQKTEASSSEMYFNYYGMIMHQQNMLQVGHAGPSISVLSVSYRFT